MRYERLRRAAGCIAALIAGLNGCDVAPRDTPRIGWHVESGPHMRSRADAVHRHVWTLTPEGLRLFNTRTREHFVIALPSWQWVGGPYACPPDVAIGPDGAAVVTSNILPTLWRVDPRTRIVTVHALELDADHEKDVGFTGIAYSRAHDAFWAASSVHGSLWRIDRTLRRAHKVAVTEALRNVCELDAQRLPVANAGGPPLLP